MGNEHSGLNDSQLRSQRDEDISFISCSTDQPIGADSTFKSSPKVISKSKLLNKSLVNSKIVVVTEVSSKKEEKDNIILKKLDSIPVIQPFIPLHHSLTNKANNDFKLYRLNGKLWTDLLQNYHNHLRQCSDAVMFDQNTLVSKIKEVDSNLTTQYLLLIEKRNKFSKYMEQIQKVQEISTALKRIHNTLKNTIHVMNTLNSLLPANDQIEPFSLGYGKSFSILHSEANEVTSLED